MTIPGIRPVTFCGRGSDENEIDYGKQQLSNKVCNIWSTQTGKEDNIHMVMWKPLGCLF